MGFIWSYQQHLFRTLFLEAARKLRTLLLETAAKELMVPPESLAAHDNVIYCLDDEARRIPFSDLVKMAETEHGTLSAVGSYTPPRRGGRFKGAGVGPTPAYTYAACVAAVDVDTETGNLIVEKIWLAHDVGKAINPLLVEG